MKYFYAYKTSDGVRHEDVIEAPSRDKAFEYLRQRGIKAIKVVAGDGSKANGEVHGIRKRIFIASLIGVAVLAGITTHVLTRTSPLDIKLPSFTKTATPQSRHCLQNVPADLSRLFKFEVERFLVNFAQPAEPLKIDLPPIQPLADELVNALKTPIEIYDSDSVSDIELKGVVEGLKIEASQILKSGRSAVEVLTYFIDRQRMEFEHRKRIAEQVKSGEMTKESANSLFRSMCFKELE